MKLEADPRVTAGANFFASTIDWMRRATRAVNERVESVSLLGFTVTRSGANGTQATIAPVNGGNGDARLVLDKVGPAQNSVVTGSKSGLKRWEWVLGSAVAEAGANAGSDANLTRFDDAGNPIANAISFRRSDGRVDIAGAVFTGAAITSTGNMNAPTFVGSGGQAIGWSSDVAGAGETYNMLAYHPTGSGSGGVNYQRSYHLHGVWAGWQFICQGAGIFEMRGSGTGYSAGGWVATSDGRFKVNRQPLGDVLAWIDDIEPCEYDRTDITEFDGTPVHRAGFIANHFEARAPALVLRDKPTDDNPDPIRSLDYDGATAYLWRAVQQLKGELAAVRAELAVLKGA